MAIGKVAVLGGGPASLAAAGDLALRGHEVHFWGRNVWKLAGFFKFKQVKMVGGVEGTAQLAGASDDLAQTLKGAKLILIVLPATAQQDVAERCAPFIEDGQVILICANGGMGSVEVARTLRNRGVTKDVIFADFASVPIGARFAEPGVVLASPPLNLGVKYVSKSVGVFPARRTKEAMEVISQAYPPLPACENCLAASLRVRAIQHQALTMLMNATIVDEIMYWDIMEEGQTPSVVKVVKTVDDERKALQKAWGFEISEVYAAAHLSGEKKARDALGEQEGSPWRRARVGRKWAWKDRLDMQHRFVTEAVPYGYVLRSSVAVKAGIKVPIIDSVIHIFSAINGEDYFNTGRNLDSLGLGDMNVEQIQRFLYEGYS